MHIVDILDELNKTTSQAKEATSKYNHHRGHRQWIKKHSISAFQTCKIDCNLISNLFSSLPTFFTKNYPSIILWKLTENLCKAVEISIAYHSQDIKNIGNNLFFFQYTDIRMHI
ncbi:hypothetical protein T03_563 [Trichinella britovi]|uniref:Uncharacterized protein n=1 Tax=Trichinella britovi TaxID=45882 RepID=A0A0V1CLH1_TRIBR|nr:hypothetical protein T03_9047 [Trichinella britovi]KRY50133.1 hypothetical protein T03_563 [Trichinella britovi]